jgi:hypothetical protein
MECCGRRSGGVCDIGCHITVALKEERVVHVKNVVMLGVMCCAVLSVQPSFAQLSNFKNAVAGKLNAPPTAAASTLAASKKRLLNAYLASSQDLTQGLAKAAQAFGVQPDVVKNLSVLQSLSKGNFSSATLAAKQKATDAVAALLKKKAQGGVVVPAAGSQQLLSESIGHLIRFLQGNQAILKDSQGLSAQAQAALKGASLADMGKIKDVASFAAAMGKALPADLKSSKDLLTQLVSYAKANNINVPSIAAGLLK